MSLNWFPLLFFILLTLFLIGCGKSGVYEGDGNIYKVEMPFPGKSGYVIEMPWVNLNETSKKTFKIKRLPRQGTYVIFLELDKNDDFSLLRWKMELQKNGELQWRLDSDADETREEQFNGTRRRYFSSVRSGINGRIVADDVFDQWEIRVGFPEVKTKGIDSRARLTLKVDGYM